MSSIKISSIVAMAENRIIGNENALIWHLSEDLKHFKKVTMGKPLVMGRKSFESLPGVLPGRPHVVVSRAEPSTKSLLDDRVHWQVDLSKALDTAKTLAKKSGQDEIFIAGGGEIYKQTLDVVQRLYLTIVHQDFKGDTYFPQLKWEEWSVSDVVEHDEDIEKDLPAFTIMTLDRL